MVNLENDWAFIGIDSDDLLLGEGPFTAHKECPLHTTSFYHNTFDLSNPTPWYVPAKVHQLSIEDLRAIFPKFTTSDLKWDQPNAGDFSTVFKEITLAISQGQLKKSVPVVTEIAKNTDSLFDTLPSQLSSLHPNLTPYGIKMDESGFVGASPEYLFQSFEGKLKTMALAGTAREEERDIFAFDQKEIQEHEFVAQTLLDTLTPLGMTRRHERRILPLNSLIHFHTSIDVELYHSQRPDTLIHHLHPTPALGPLPRTESTMGDLIKWRKKLGCPSHFGAPFGVYHEGRLHLLVAIRMIALKENNLVLPSGCGIIEASRLTSEWRELELKRNSVKKFFGL